MSIDTIKIFGKWEWLNTNWWKDFILKFNNKDYFLPPHSIFFEKGYLEIYSYAYCTCQFLTLAILCKQTSLSKHFRSGHFTEVHSSLGQTLVLGVFFCFVHILLVYSEGTSNWTVICQGTYGETKELNIV